MQLPAVGLVSEILHGVAKERFCAGAFPGFVILIEGQRMGTLKKEGGGGTRYLIMNKSGIENTGNIRLLVKSAGE